MDRWVKYVSTIVLGTAAIVGAAAADDRQDCMSYGARVDLPAGIFRVRVNPAFVDDVMASADAAIAACTRATTKSEPDTVPLLINRGRAHQMKGNHVSAFLDFHMAISLDPQNAAALTSRGNLYRERANVSGATDDFALAIADLDAAIKIAPNNADAHEARANAYAGKNDFDAAVAGFNDAVRLDPKNPTRLLARGNFYFKNDKPDLAIADFNAALKLGLPDGARSDFNARALISRALAHEKKGDEASKLADLGEAIRRGSEADNVTFALITRAVVYKSRGESDRAMADVTKALSLYPDNQRMRKRLEEIRDGLSALLPRK